MLTVANGLPMHANGLLIGIPLAPLFPAKPIDQPAPLTSIPLTPLSPFLHADENTCRSWGIVIPSGALLAIAGKSWLPPKQGVGLNWFLAHRALGYAGALMSLAGVLIGRAVATGSDRAASHRLVGYAAALVRRLPTLCQSPSSKWLPLNS